MPKEHKYELIHHSEDDTFLISILNAKRESIMKKMHAHDHYEITIFKPLNKNKTNIPTFEFYVENLKYTITSSLFMLVPPKVKHMTTRPKYTQRTIINFREDFGRPIFDFLNIDMDLFFRKRIIKIAEDKLDEVYNLIYKIHAEYETSVVSTKLRLLLAELFLILNEPTDDIIPHQMNDLKIAPVIDYMKTYYNTPLDLDFLATKFFISKFTICREIKAVTGLTFSEYLTQLRINSAKKMLENSKFSVSEIARKVGFTTPEYFSKTFKKEVNLSPSEYRKQIIKT